MDVVLTLDRGTVDVFWTWLVLKVTVIAVRSATVLETAASIFSSPVHLVRPTSHHSFL